MKKPLFLSGVLAFALTPFAPAALLLYEGFNGYSDGAALNVVTPNANTIGLATDGTGASYANASDSNPSSTMTITGTGLTFGSLVVNGGAAKSGSSTAVAAANITSTTTSTVIWGSYLVNLSTTNDTTSNGFEVRLNSSSTSSSTTANLSFRSDADTRGSASAAIAVSFDGSLTAGSGALNPGTTYLLVSKFDTSVSGGATLWALTLAQFEDFVAAGRTESFLNDTSGILKASDPLAAANGWNTSTTPAYFEIVSSGMGTNGATFDEIRYGESLFDVTPVPEPSAALVTLPGLALLLRRRRK